MGRAQPGDRVRRLDEFSRRWPLAACFIGFGYVATRGLIDGSLFVAVVFGALALACLLVLSRMISTAGDEHRRSTSP